MTYKAGQWNALCDVCGFKFKSSELKKRWDGLMVCEDDFEQDHPQKFLRVQEDRQTVPWARPRNENDTQLTVCYLYDLSAYADYGSADCAKADNTQYPFSLIKTLK